MAGSAEVEQIQPSALVPGARRTCWHRRRRSAGTLRAGASRRAQSLDAHVARHSARGAQRGFDESVLDESARPPIAHRRRSSTRAAPWSGSRRPRPGSSRRSSRHARHASSGRRRPCRGRVRDAAPRGSTSNFSPCHGEIAFLPFQGFGRSSTCRAPERTSRRCAAPPQLRAR